MWVVVVILFLLIVALISKSSATTTPINTTLIPSSSDNSQVIDTSSTLESLFGMSNLTASQIKDYAMQAGFIGDGLTTAIAVALAESQGNTKAYNPETQANTPQGMGSYGLWQIYLKAHPEFNGWDLYDPLTNAIAAFQTSNAGLNWQPWSTFKNGRYLSYLSQAVDAVNS